MQHVCMQHVYVNAALDTGLKYAEEIGPEGDPNPRYFCHLCKIHMDCNNVGLHFTSTAHRHTVLVREGEGERSSQELIC